jgi:hypothetical protein
MNLSEGRDSNGVCTEYKSTSLLLEAMISRYFMHMLIGTGPVTAGYVT